ncbi:hypothetical protein [Pseudodesulfovibrio indicus]|uniref:hypothetical protein n=1 Tax=Pseudodesulfovibrio indicus TaxID=1716143 RepID=UPI00292EEFA3|nr:hypothetical protein [Pseudodesulfovibrio indicus]
MRYLLLLLVLVCAFGCGQDDVKDRIPTPKIVGGTSNLKTTPDDPFPKYESGFKVFNSDKNERFEKKALDKIGVDINTDSPLEAMEKAMMDME